MLKNAARFDLIPTKHTYLVLNFETFQQPDSAAMVRRLVEKHQIDFVVLDEIQSVKQRTPKVTSKRRQVVSGLLSAASETESRPVRAGDERYARHQQPV